MSECMLPIHPRTGLRAAGIVAGRPVWPIRGGSEPAGDPGAGDADPAGQQSGPSQQQQQYTPPASQADLDRIVETRLSRERAKYGNLTPEQLDELRTKAEAHDKMQYDLSSEHEKALADIKTETAADVAAVFVPKLVNAELRAASAGRISADDLNKALEFVDPEKFLTDDGADIDPARISTFIDGVAPAQASSGTGARIIAPPRQLGQGNLQPAGAKAGEAGRAMAEKRFGKSS